MDTKLFIDIIGWIGSVEIIIAYGLISYKRIDADSPYYQWLNLTGSIFLIANTWYYGAFPSTLINVFWLVIAFFALLKMRAAK